MGAVVEAEGLYTPTRVSRTFATPKLAAGVECWYAQIYSLVLNHAKVLLRGYLRINRHSFDFLTPVWHSLPSWLAQTRYQNPINTSHTAFQLAYETTEGFFAFLARQPQFLKVFQLYKTAFAEGRASWIDFSPIEARLGHGAHEDKDAVPFVDVGGGLGHEGSALRTRYPGLPGRFVLQDLPAVILRVKSDLVEPMAHNFSLSNNQ